MALNPLAGLQDKKAPMRLSRGCSVFDSSSACHMLVCRIISRSSFSLQKPVSRRLINLVRCWVKLYVFVPLTRHHLFFRNSRRQFMICARCSWKTAPDVTRRTPPYCILIILIGGWDGQTRAVTISLSVRSYHKRYHFHRGERNQENWIWKEKKLDGIALSSSSFLI